MREINLEKALDLLNELGYSIEDFNTYDDDTNIKIVDDIREYVRNIYNIVEAANDEVYDAVRALEKVIGE